jgi:aldehyde:ferredoxin oxidoreductase
VKAVGVRGERRTSFARPEELIAFSKDLSKKSFGPATAKYRELGTVSNLLTFNRLGTLPTRNFQQGTFDGASQLTPESLESGLPRTRESCAACTIGCEHIFQRPGGQTGVRMEYENLFALGPLCGISDPATVLEASAFCDEWDWTPSAPVRRSRSPWNAPNVASSIIPNFVSDEPTPC